jgi:hypothetical protein
VKLGAIPGGNTSLLVIVRAGEDVVALPIDLIRGLVTYRQDGISAWYSVSHVVGFNMTQWRAIADLGIRRWGYRNLATPNSKRQ